MNMKRYIMLVLCLSLLSVLPALVDAQNHRAKGDEHISDDEPNKSQLQNNKKECSREVLLLLEKLQDRNPEVRRDAALHLGHKGSFSLLSRADTTAAASALLRCLHDEDRKVRNIAVWTLTTIKPVAAVAIPALINLSTDDDRDTRKWAMVGLGRTRRSSKLLLSALINGLKDSDQEVRAYAATALSDIGPSARSAIPALITSGVTVDPLGCQLEESLPSDELTMRV